MTATASAAQSSWPVSFEGVLAAAEAVWAHLPPTPAWAYPLLDETVGSRVVVKHENVQPIGAFKVRGGLALLDALPEDELRHGIVTASTGNHAQSVAYAARRHGVDATIVVPTTAPAGKIAAVRALGARIVVHGDEMGGADRRARELASETGRRFVSPGDEPAIVHGHATTYLELFRSHPDLEAVYVPIGSGTGAAGACLVRDALAPGCRVVGVQSAQAPAAHRSWSEGRPVSGVPCTTRSSGLATTASFALPQLVLRDRLDDFLLVDDADIDDARRTMARAAHTLAEGAGAAALAGALLDPERPGRIAVVCTGGNADEAELATLIVA